MANVQITMHNTTSNSTIAGVKFTNGVATVDDTTDAGKKLIALAKRQGWAYGSTAAVAVTVDEGKPYALWTTAEMKAYLDSFGVTYDPAASDDDLRAVIATAYETRAQGGSAALPAAGHTQGTFPVLDAPYVRGDDEAKADKYSPPVMPLLPGGDNGDTFPEVTNQPNDASVVAPATASFTIAVAGTPSPTIQWQRKGDNGQFADIAGATSATYTTAATTVDGDNGARFRAVVTNSEGSTTSDNADLTVTAS